MDSEDRVASIRQMRPEDSEEISRIYSDITKTTVQADFATLIQAHAQDKDSASFVAELDGRVIGFMISYITLGFGIEKSAWIAAMGVDPRYMGQGIGALWPRKSLNSTKHRGLNASIPPSSGIPPICCHFSGPWISREAISSTWQRKLVRRRRRRGRDQRSKNAAGTGIRRCGVGPPILVRD